MSDLERAEKAVREYFEYLQDPSAFIPDTSELEEKISREQDTIAKLKLYSELADMKDPGSKLRAEFIAHARYWAKANNIRPEAFIEANVPVSILQDAGLIKKQKRRGGSSRKPRVEGGELARVIETYSPGTTFTYEDLVRDTNLSPSTVYQRFSEYVEKGIVVDDGLAEQKHPNGGRRPRRFKKVG